MQPDTITSQSNVSPPGAQPLNLLLLLRLTVTRAPSSPPGSVASQLPLRDATNESYRRMTARPQPPPTGSAVALINDPGTRSAQMRPPALGPRSRWIRRPDHRFRPPVTDLRHRTVSHPRYARNPPKTTATSIRGLKTFSEGPFQRRTTVPLRSAQTANRECDA